MRAPNHSGRGLCCHLKVSRPPARPPAHSVLLAGTLGWARTVAQTCACFCLAVAAAVRTRAAQGPRNPPQEAAVGPKHSPSKPAGEPDIKPAAAPAPLTRVGPVGSEGDWAGRRRQEQAGSRRRGNNTAAVCPDVTGGVQGAGRCTDVCDQLYATCAAPTDLPMGTPPPPGGPVGSSPPKLPLPLLTRRDVLAAVINGTLTVSGVAAQQAGATLTAEQAAFASPADSPRLFSSGRSATRAASAEQGITINSGDSWAIRNQNCQLAPIHGIMNRVLHWPGQPTVSFSLGARVTQDWMALTWRAA